LGYSLRVNVKKLEASAVHPEREKQCDLIETQKQRFESANLPIISVDTKKKELIGNFKNAGQAWGQQPQSVNMHDFPHEALGKAVPYGIYDLAHNRGAVYVGSSADTPEFAVTVLVWNSPTGCSKWNPIEHRLFSYISLNWAGCPLRSFDILLNYLRGTTTRAGLTVRATLLKGEYAKGQRVSDTQMEQLNIEYAEVCAQWNYTLRPRVADHTFGNWQDILWS
jgi:hypothetical protein